MSYKKLFETWAVKEIYEGYEGYEGYMNNGSPSERVNNNNQVYLEILNKNLMIFVKPDLDITKRRRAEVLGYYTPLGININYVEGPGENEWGSYPIFLEEIHAKRGKGVKGLIASFIKCLQIAKEKGWKTLVLFEDDAIPIDRVNFMNEFKKSIDSLPTNWKNEPYVLQLGTTIYCREDVIINTEEDVWVDKPVPNSGGSHAYIFTQKSIDIILKDIYSNGVNMPLDHYLKGIRGVKYLRYTGKISSSGMFSGLFDQLYTYCDRRESIIQ